MPGKDWKPSTLQKLTLLDGLFDDVAKRCNEAERQQVLGAKDYFHISEEASRHGRDGYRRDKFEELQTGIRDMTVLVEILRTNTTMSPMAAKILIKDFRSF